MGDLADPVQAYLDALPPDRKAALSRLRDLILAVAPGAAAAIAYKMPTFTLGQHYGAAFASQKQYMSLYVDPAVLARYQDALLVRGIDLGKSCIRFRRYDALPLDVVRSVLAESFGIEADQSP